MTLQDDLTSRRHAKFVVSAEQVTLHDLGSRNGTFVNGKRVVDRAVLREGDTVRIGREVLIVQAVRVPVEGSGARRLPQTLSPGEDTQFPSLIGQLVEKSLRVGKVREAERYATALVNQLSATQVSEEHPASRACVKCLIDLAEHSSSGVWIDRVFHLYVSQSWVMPAQILERIRTALDRIPRVPGGGIAEYEGFLRRMQRTDTSVETSLVSSVAELADAYGRD